MKKIFLLFLMLVSFTAQAQKLTDKGKFTLNVKLGDKEAQAVSYHIHQADRDFRMSGKPVATIPVKDGTFRYEVELNRLVGIRLKGVSADGKEVGKAAELLIMPGAELSIRLQDGKVTYLDEDTYNYVSRMERYAWDVRRERKWTTPRLPKPIGKHWAQVKQESSDFYRMSVKEVWLGQKATVVRLVTEPSEHRRGAEKNDYLLDDKGRTYRMLRPLLGKPGEELTAEAAVMGGFYAFEPLPANVKTFSYVSDSCKISDIREAPVVRHAPNFTVTIKPTTGITDSGYLIYSMDKFNGDKSTAMLADLPCNENREVTYQMYIEEPTTIHLTATFPGGNVCTAGVRVPAFPDSHLKVSVMNGTYDYSGTGAYKQMEDLRDFYRNAFENISHEDYKKAEEKVRLYIMDHANEQGTLYEGIRSNILDIEQLHACLNSTQLATPMGRLVKGKYEAEKKRRDELYRVANEKQNALLQEVKRHRDLGDKEADEPFDHADFPVGNAVDLGLSVLWADMNVGAKAPEQSGYYYAWGEVSPIHDKPVEWATYKWCEGNEHHLTKYNTKEEFGKVDNLTTLQPCDDVAHVRWGGDWRMPTADELQELCDKCTWEWIILNNQPGNRITGPNGNSIFLPATGMYNHKGYDTAMSGKRGYLWSSTLNPDSPEKTSYLWHHEKNHGTQRGTTERRPGIAVRPVQDK